MTKHTAGSWDRIGTMVYCLETATVRRGGEVQRNRFDANVQGPYCPQEEKEANARLISAAPDLLDALSEARTYVAFAYDQGVLGAYEAGEKLDAAIAKATQA